MQKRKASPTFSDQDRWRRPAHCLQNYRGLLKLCNADLTEGNYLRLLFDHQFQGDPFHPAPTVAQLEVFARADRPIGGKPFDPRDALERAKVIQAYTRRVLDRLLAGRPDPLRDQTTGQIDLQLPLVDQAYFKSTRRPFDPDLKGRRPAVVVDEHGSFPMCNDFEDYWYGTAAQFVAAHRRYGIASRCTRPVMGPSSPHCRRCDLPVVGCADRHDNDPEAKRQCSGLRHLPFRRLRKSDPCGHFHFRPNGKTCSRKCTLALGYLKRRKARRPRPRPALPALRPRRKTFRARFGQHSS